jgi:uncharacterized protein YdeI (YjbR/CyaY-like superfamily)
MRLHRTDKPTAVEEVRTGLPILAFAMAAHFEEWLVLQPGGSKGLWLKLARKTAGVRCVGKQAAIEVALCHGWIDGQLNPYDDKFWLIRFTPRSAKRRWSEINRTTVTRLMALGRVSPAGLAQVEVARANGRWQDADAPQSTVTVPPDLQSALDANPEAKLFFDALAGANRYAVRYRIQDARTARTRRSRIDRFIGMVARHEVLHAPRPKAFTKAPG